MVVEIETFTVGPGVLLLGSAPRFDASPRLLSLKVAAAASVNRTEPRKVLSGAQTKGSRRTTYTWTAAGRFLQDLDAAGLLTWTWTHRATEQAFIYVPNNDADRAVSGILIPNPIGLGGDVDVDGPEDDFTWDIEGDPTYGTYDPVTHNVTPIV